MVAGRGNDLGRSPCTGRSPRFASPISSLLVCSAFFAKLRGPRLTAGLVRIGRGQAKQSPP